MILCMQARVCARALDIVFSGTLLMSRNNIGLQEFSPGSSGRMSTMGAYVRDLLLGQVR